MNSALVTPVKVSLRSLAFLVSALLSVDALCDSVDSEPIFSLVSTPGIVASRGGASVTLLALNTGNEVVELSLPETIHGILVEGKNRWPVELSMAAASSAERVMPGRFTSFPLEFDPPTGVHGLVLLELNEPVFLRTALELENGNSRGSSEGSSPVPLVVTDDDGGLAPIQDTAVAQIKRAYASNIDIYKPIYFLYGADAPAAKFQFSFRYQLAREDGWLTRKLPLLKGLTFAYTQRSLWDIDGDSNPFYDTSYMPEIGYLFLNPDDGNDRFFHWLGWQTAVYHESNGKGGVDSRSLNTFFVRPGVAFGDLNGWNLRVIPTLYAYLEDSEFAEYRGNVDLGLAFGRNDGPELAITGRIGREWSKGAVQVDFTLPTSFLGGSLATFLHVQYWNGYGESLLGYDQSTETVRFGLSLVR